MPTSDSTDRSSMRSLNGRAVSPPRKKPRITLVAASGFAMAPLMGAGLTGVFAFLSLLLFAMGFVYGPLSAWLTDLFPPRVRYTGASMTFNIAGVIGGGLTPVIAQGLALEYGLMPVGWYLSAAAALSLVALLALRERRADA